MSRFCYEMHDIFEFNFFTKIVNDENEIEKENDWKKINLFVNFITIFNYFEKNVQIINKLEV